MCKQNVSNFLVAVSSSRLDLTSSEITLSSHSVLFLGRSNPLLVGSPATCQDCRLPFSASLAIRAFQQLQEKNMRHLTTKASTLNSHFPFHRLGSILYVVYSEYDTTSVVQGFWLWQRRNGRQPAKVAQLNFARSVDADHFPVVEHAVPRLDRQYDSRWRDLRGTIYRGFLFQCAQPLATH